MSDFTATRPYSYTALTLIDQNQNNPNETTIYSKFNAAINATTGHAHTGSTGDGPIIPVTGGGTGVATAPLARTALGLNSQLGWFRNISITRATTTNTGDSVKITSGDGTALSSTNYGTVFLPSTVTAGLTTEFTVTADVTILLTGITPNIDGAGDITGALLNILAINDNGTLKWGVAYLTGRTTLLTTDTTATQASVTAPEHVLCNSAVSSASNRCRVLGFVRADFDDAGGAAENLWSIQSGINDCVTGQSSDGLWRPWGPVSVGWSGNPTDPYSMWTQVGRTVFINHSNSGATSNAVTKTIDGPAKALTVNETGWAGYASDNSVVLINGAAWQTRTGSSRIDFYTSMAQAAWTASGTCILYANLNYVVGPAASFID